MDTPKRNQIGTPFSRFEVSIHGINFSHFWVSNFVFNFDFFCFVSSGFLLFSGFLAFCVPSICLISWGFFFCLVGYFFNFLWGSSSFFFWEFEVLIFFMNIVVQFFWVVINVGVLLKIKFLTVLL